MSSTEVPRSLAGCSVRTPEDAVREGRIDADMRARRLASQCPLFDNLPATVIDQMMAQGFSRTVRRGEVIYTEGSPATWGFIVCQGSTALGRATPGRKRQFMTLFLPGDVFGMVNIFDGSHYTARAVAIADAQLLQLPADAVREWPGLDASVAKAMVSYFAAQVLRANGSVAALMCPDTGSRLASFLLDLALRAGTPSSDGIIIRHALTQEQLAHYVGSSRESVNRALQEMKQRGVISMEYGAMHVLDREWLVRKSQNA